YIIFHPGQQLHCLYKLSLQFRECNVTTLTGAVPTEKMLAAILWNDYELLKDWSHDFSPYACVHLNR
ncbi:hypothetical protein STEG23_014040, partial [Scotinomys teguina]